jgi:hypothetical protein
MFSLLMSDRRRRMFEQRQRNISQMSQLSSFSVASTVSDFLEEKVKGCKLELDYIKTYKEGLHEAQSAKKSGKDEFDEELNTVLGDFRSVQEDLKILKKAEENHPSKGILRKRLKPDSGTEPKAMAQILAFLEGPIPIQLSPTSHRLVGCRYGKGCALGPKISERR